MSTAVEFGHYTSFTSPASGSSLSDLGGGQTSTSSVSDIPDLSVDPGLAVTYRTNSQVEEAESPSVNIISPPSPNMSSSSHGSDSNNTSHTSLSPSIPEG